MGPILRLNVQIALGLVLGLLAMVALPSHRGGAAGPPTETLTVFPTDDTYVESSSANANYGGDDRLRADDRPIRNSYLLFDVTGVEGRAVESARLRLEAKSASVTGGTVHVITDTAWDESTVTFNNRPAIDGPGLSTLGNVAPGDIVEFNLDGAIPGDGLYAIAIDSTSSDGISYASSTATNGEPPQLVLSVASGPNPTVTIVQPPDGSTFFVGDLVQLQATVVDDVDVGLEALVEWTSDLDGSLGAGGSIAPALSEGSHIVSADVVDSDQLPGSDQIGITIVPPPAENTAPLVAITSPLNAQTFTATQAVPFTGTATDLEDGSLTGDLAWTSDQDGPIGQGGSFSTTLSEGTHQVTANVTDSGSLQGSATVSFDIVPPDILEFPATADTYVDEKRPAVNYGSSTLLRVDASSERITYLRFSVTGVGARTVTRATLRMDVDTDSGAASDSGGTVHTISDTTWDEGTLTYDTRPPVDGPALATVGAVASGEVVDFDVTAAIGGDAVYNLALVGVSRDGVKYRSREAGTPTLILELSGNPPAVTITAPTDGHVLFTDELPLGLSGTATDIEDGDLSAELVWTSNLDGGLGTGSGVSAAGLSIGQHTITAAATDTDSLTGQAAIAVTVRTPNVAPQVSITTPTGPTSVPAGATINLAATATDDFDGNLGSSITWSSVLDGTLGTGTALTVALTEGNHTVTASVVDSDGAPGMDQVTVTVTPTPPAVTVLAPANGAVVFGGNPVSFSGTALDATDGDLSGALAWTSDLDGVIGAGASFTTTTLSEGTHTVTAAVTDTGGLGGQAPVTVVVRPPNNLPAVTIDAPADGTTVLSGEPIGLSGTATDVEDGDLSAQIDWTSDLDGPLGTGQTLTVPGLSAGTHTLMASVTDLDGAPASATVTVNVGNATLTIMAAADTYVDANTQDAALGAEQSFRVDASPVREAYLRFPVTGVPPFAVQQAILRLTVGPKRGNASESAGTVHSMTDNSWSEATTTFTTRPTIDGPALATQGAVRTGDVVDFDVTAAVLADGTYNFGMVTDISDAAGFRSREAGTGVPLLILTLTENSRPVVSITSPPTGTMVLPATSVTLIGTGTDAEDGDLSDAIQWSSDLQGALGAGATVTVTLSPGQHSITAEVTDSSGATDRAQITINVGSPPDVVITAPADGTVVFNYELPIELSGTATDVEDGVLSSELTWSSSLDGVLDTGASITVAPSVGQHTITATVTDSDGIEGQAAIGLRVRTPNVAPVLAITAPADGATGPAGTTMGLAATADDDFDGDISAQVTWTSDVDGSLGTGAALTVLLREGSHTLTASVVDSDGAPAADQVTVVVTPTAPVVTVVAPEGGTTVFVGATLTFAGTAMDATDGELSGALVWTSDLDGQVGTGDSFSTAALSVGTHTVTAAVTDTGGLGGEAQVTVIVRPPNELPVVAIHAPLDGAMLLPPVALSGTATDVEDGDLSSEIQWASDLDGPLGTGQAVTAPGLSPGTHTLTASVTDRDGAPGSAGVTVTVGNTTLTVPVEADTYVDDSDPTTALGSEDSFRLDASPVRETYLRFSVAGVPPFAVQQAILRLTVGPKRGNASKVGGTFHSMSDNSWSEATTTFTTRPAIDGPVLATWGPVETGEVIDVDVTAAILADGTYSFGLVSASSDGAGYRSREALSGKPQLILSLKQNTVPVVEIASPASGSVTLAGALVTLTGTATDTDDGDMGDQIQWRSNLDGVLGTGSTLALTTLSTGSHTITAEVTDSSEATSQATVDVVIEDLPVVTIDSPSDQSNHFITEPISFSATATDIHDGDLSSEIAWTSSLDGEIGTGASVASSTLSLGTHVITAAVEDSRSFTGEATVSILVEVNDPPTVTITAPAELTNYVEGTLAAFTATAVDPEEGDLSAGMTWTSSLDGPLGAGPTVTTSSLSVGTHVISATAADSRALDDTDTVTVTVEVNDPPVVAITAPVDGSTVHMGEEITFAGSGIDPEDGDLTAGLTWSSDQQGTIGAGAGFTTSGLSIGTHVITASVADTLGLSGSAQITVYVINDTPAVAIGVPADGMNTFVLNPVTFSGTAFDTEDGDLTAGLSWQSSRDGLLGVGGGFTTTALSIGTHVVTADVTDSGGATGTRQIALTVDPIPPGTGAPVVTITAPAPSSVFDFGDPVTYQATALDPDDGDISSSLVWSSDVEGVFGTGASVVSSTLPIAVHTITATITDSDGITRFDSIPVEIQDPNALPVVTIATPLDGADVNEQDSVSFSATALDLEDGDLTAGLEWTSDLDGPIGTGGSFTSAALTPGTHLITATVTDSKAEQGSASVSLTVHAIPVVTIVLPLQNTGFLAGTAADFFADAADVEDGDVSASLNWTSDLDGLIGSGKTFSIDTLSTGIHTVTAVATNARGGVGTAQVSFAVANDLLIFSPTADAYVDQGSPSTNFGNETLLMADAGPNVREAYLRFEVAGMEPFPVNHADLHLTATNNGDSDFGGEAHTFTDGTWTETGVTFDNRPVVDGPSIAAINGLVEIGDVVDFDVTSALTADGTYNFALVTYSTDAVKYKSREAVEGQPQLRVFLGQPDAPQIPQLTITEPSSGSVIFDDTPITLTATASDAEDGDLTGSISWRSNLDGSLGTGGTITVSLSRGEHTLSASVQDNFGLSATGVVTITVVDRPPQVTITEPGDGLFFPSGFEITFTGTAFDNLDGDLASTMEWASHRDGVIGTGPSVSSSVLSAGDHLITAKAINNVGTIGTDTITIFIDQAPPQVTIQAPPDGTTVGQGTPVTLIGSATDVEDGDLSGSLAWSSDLVGPLGTGETLPIALTTVGSHLITASVTDSHGFERSAEITLHIALSPPVVSISAPLDGAGFVGPVAFAGTAVDVPDGDLSAGIQWTSSVDGPLGTGDTLPAAQLTAGAHVVTAQATDNDGLVGSASISIVIGASPPIVEILEPVGSAALESETTSGLGDPVTFTATALDASGVDLSEDLRWISDLDGTLGTGASITISTLVRGRHVITAEATDSTGLTGSAQIVVVVTVNAGTIPPNVSISTPSSGAVVNAGADVTFSASAEDDAGSDLSSYLSWVSNLDGFVGNGASFVATLSSVGSHTITASVFDANALVGSATVNVTVVPPFASFQAEADTYDDGSQNTTNFGTSTELRVDADPSQRTYLRFSVTGITGLNVQSAVVRLQTTSQSSAGSDHGGDLYSITGSTWDELALTYLNAPPVDGAFLQSAGAVSPSQAVDFDVTSAIVGDGIYSFAITPVSTDAAVYRSRESAVGSPELIVFFEAPVPQEPSVDIIEPANLATLPSGAPSVFAATAYDAQDGDLGVAVIWRSNVDGMLSIGSPVSPTLSPGPHVITATVNDVDGFAGADLIHVVVGEGPVVAIDTPTDGSVLAFGDASLLSGSAFDPQEGDLASLLEWSSDVDGALGTGPSIAPVLSPGTHTIMARATDDDGNTGSATVGVTVSAGDVGFRDYAYGPGVEQDNNRLTGAKPETKLWYAGGFWWGTLYSPADAAYAIHRLDRATQTWISSGVVIDERPTSRQDALLDGNTLYLASRMSIDPGENRLYRYTYHPDAQTYVLDPGFPVTIAGSGTEALTIAKDSTGKLWMVYTLNDKVMVNHTLGSDTEWATPFVVPIGDENPDAANVWFDDIAAVQVLDGAMGVFWANQLTKKDYLAVHPDGASPSDPASWTLELAASGGSVADDHFNLKLASDGRLFVVIKTSRSSIGSTLLALLVRSPAGTWSGLHHITNAEFKTTRPIVLLDDSRRQVHVFYSPFEGAIYTKMSDMDTIAFPDPGGIGTPFINNSRASVINNPTSTKQNLDPTTGLVVLASGSGRYWHGTIDPEPAPVVEISSPVDAAKVAAGASLGFSGTAFSVADGIVSDDLTWASSLDGPIGTGESFSTAGLSEGIHVVTASVTDSSLATGSATVRVTVEAEAAPVVDIVQPGTGEKFLLGEPVTFVGTALDSLDGDLTGALQWTSDVQGLLGTGGSPIVAGLSLGVHTITAQAIDSAGLSGSASIAVEIQVNAPPVVAITSPVDGVVANFGAAVPFAGTATDAFDDNLTASLTWTSDRDGAIGTGGSFSRSSLSLGAHTITASATDSHGLSDSETVTVNVVISP